MPDPTAPRPAGASPYATSARADRQQRFSAAALDARRYASTGQPHPEPLDGAWTRPEPYVAPDALRRAVNMALFLRRPLLLEGEPGAGKTRLAYAVACELGYPLKEITVRSTSQARDLLYTFDAVRRLYDIQERAAGGGAAPGSLPPDLRKYIRLGELGEAIELAERDTPSVVLIDEIDKADIDFPNDLLLELDRLQFRIEELGEPHDALFGQTRAARRPFLPLVIITSNREKELPPAFLRRCLYYFIPFPQTADDLAPILDAHFPAESRALCAAAVAQFLNLRRKPWRKPPGASELIDWIAVLERDVAEDPRALDALATGDPSRLPYLEALLKTQSDREALLGKAE
jgi:MoxR-like ATPase